MSQLDDLLHRSRSPGRFVERRRFTLSREKAIEKQREFTLRNPRQYVLELVQAAVFAGATYIAIDTRPHSALVAWVGGRHIPDRDLEHLLDYLFVDRGDPRWRHLVQLAVAVNALLQRRPRTLRIETGDGERAVRMDLDANGRAQLGTVEDAIAGTYLYAEFGGGWFSRFTGSTHTPEQGLVETKCLYTPVPILLNGSAPFGYRGSRRIEIFGAREQVHFDAQGRRGVVALHSSKDAPKGFRIVVGGVWITTLPGEALSSQPLVGVICDDNLRKTADHSDIVQDPHFVRMLHAVQPYATAVMRRADAAYVPPPLPPIPRDVQDEESAPAVAPEPLPDILDAVQPRLPMTLGFLRQALASLGPDTPIFFCSPDHLEEVAPAADPLRFPYRVLTLTPGQAVTLERTLPRIALHRLQSRADVDFVRRVLERQSRIREHRFTVGDAGGQVILRLHLEGRLPDWGDGSSGVPFAVLDDDGIALTGVIVGDEVRPGAGRTLASQPERLPMPLVLPRTSLVLEGVPLTGDLVGPVLEEAWKLAVPDGAQPDPRLLAALLGQVTVPQLQGHPIAVGASLPLTWPDALRHVPIVQTTEGPLSLQGFLDLLGTDRVVEVTSPDGLDDMAALEWRFGFGHLAHPSLADRPVYGVGRFGARWFWLDKAELWSHRGLLQMIFVSATFRPRLEDAHWELVDRPAPMLVAVRRGEADEDWEGGWDLLYRQLVKLEKDDAWAKPDLSVPVERARGMGRLALYHLARQLGRGDQPLLLPSDGGARRSLDEAVQDTAARFSARHGVEVAEPWTFQLTRDELAAVAGDQEVRLRFDDAPDVWRALTDRPDTGWLLRQEVRQGGLRGWLGLRHPYDGTTGILVRTTGRLVALPEMDRRIPCHGLLWPDGSSATGLQALPTGDRGVSPEQVRLLQLAGLQLYQALVSVLSDPSLDEGRAETARLYGFAFVLLAHRRGRLTGTALDLAQRIVVSREDGVPWGTVEEWLAAPEHARPPCPSELVLLEEPVETAIVDERAPMNELGPLLARLRDALEIRGVKVNLVWSTQGSKALARVCDLRSSVDQVVVELDPGAPVVKRALAAPGRAREVVLLEAARQVAVWSRDQEPSLRVDLLKLQQVLLAQRLDDDA